jgi:transglutaminase-like putative cysteine protease
VATKGTTAVLVAGVAAQLSVATVGALPWFVLPLSGLGYVISGLAAERAEGRRSDVLRGSGTALALLGLIALGPRVLSNADRVDIKEDLGMMLIIAQVGQALSWRTVRDLRSGLMASFGLLVLSASYAPDMLIGIPLLAGWVAVVCGLALLGGVGRVDAARATTVAVAVGLAAFLIIPFDPTDGARARLRQSHGGQASERLPIGAFTTDQLDLRVRGQLSTTEILRVPGSSPPLWRATSFDTYDGVSWRRDPASSRLTVPGPPYQVSVAGGPVRTDVAERLGAASRSDGTVWSPGRIVAVAGAIPPVVTEDGDVQVLPGTARYTVTSAVPVSDAVAAAGTTGADQQDPRWLALPVGLPSRVGDLARQVTSGGGSRFDKAEQITAYLRTHATYRLDSPVPLPGQDAVDRFLFIDQTGFCEQFASAQVVMLRTLGIPARLVTGLAYGVGDRRTRVFRASDLHAWTELWVQGVGWVSSDPTAGVPLADASAALTARQRVSTAITNALRKLDALPGGRPVLALVLVALGVIGSSLLTRRSPSVRRAALARPAGPALSAFLRLDERLGEQRRRAPESLRDLARRLDPALSGALNVVERECYAAAQPDPGEVRAAVAVLDRASAPDPPARRARRGRPAGRGRTARRG